MNSKLIVIDGMTYKSVDEMPEDVRRTYESAMSQLGDSNRDGVPDMLDHFSNLTDRNKNGMPDAIESIASSVFSSSTKIIVDGAEYSSLNELPPDVRAKYEQAMGTFDTNRNGIPDFLEGMMNTSAQENIVQHNHAMPALRQSLPTPSSPTIEPESTSGWMVALLVIGLLGVCALGALSAWYFFLR